MFRVRVIFYIISWVRFASLRRFQVTGKMWTPTFFPFLVTNTNGHPGKLSIMTSCMLIFVSLSTLSTCLPCRPCQPVDLVNLSTCKNMSTMSTCLPCQSVYLVNLSTCQLVILSTLQPIYQFNIHNIIHYIERINIKWIFKVKSPRTSFYHILDLSHISDDRYWLHR